MSDSMDIDSECNEVDIARETRCKGNATVDLVLDNDDTSTNSTSGLRAFGRFSTSSAKEEPEHSRPRKNSMDKALYRRRKMQKPQRNSGTLAIQNFKRRSPIRHQKRRPSRKDLENVDKTVLARVSSLSRSLVGHNPLGFFAENCGTTMAGWISLLSRTTLPDDIESSDPRIIAAFKDVDSVICGQQGTHLLRRLAYVQLMRLFAFLEKILESERQTGLVFRKPGYGNASIAIDMYISAQESQLHPHELRRQVGERKRAGRSWSDLAKPSPLFVLMYSEASESLMYICPNPSKNSLLC